MAEALLQVSHLTKAYGGARALLDVGLELQRGEIHAICGENGAGKSTLIKCLTGVEVPDEGTVLVEGEPLPFGDVRASEAAGIAVLHQESTVFGDLNAVDNLFVGREPTTARGPWLDRRRMHEEAGAVLQRLGQSFDTRRPARELSLANRQTIAMARALLQRCRLLIMDEPTASLSAREADKLLGIIRRLRDENVTVLYVSHRLEEIFQIAQRVTVLRDGQRVETREVADTTRGDLVRLMVGRELDELTKRHEHSGGVGDVRLRLAGLSRDSVFEDVSLAIRAGEIVGLAGLVGAGRSEVARAVFGVDGYDRGKVLLDGRPLPPRDVRESVRRGLALAPEDRQHEGLLLPMSVSDNLTLAILQRLTRHGLVNRRAERNLAASLMDKLQIKADSQGVPAETLSGGNQQKVVLGKWLAAEPRVLILDEPTRGIDVGAKVHVHQLIRDLAAGGMATLVISSELPELLSICDRILVMREGRISGELDGRTATQEKILELALPDATPASPPRAAG